MARTVTRPVIAAALAWNLLAPYALAAQTPSNTPARANSAEIEELIAEKASSCAAVDDEDVIADDGRKVAWRCRANDKWTVLLNGIPQGGTFDEVRSLIFSPDGQHMAYAARRGNQWMIVEDAAERSATYSDVGSLLFSADGKRIAFSAKPAKKWTLVVDGEPQPAEFDGIVYWIFSPDSRRIAYVGRRRDKFIVVVDGKEGTPSDIVGGLRFSSDSGRVAYAAADVKRGFGKQKAVGRVTIDGTAGPASEGAQVGSLLKSAVTGSTPQIYTGYVSQFWIDTHGVSAPVFSPDGMRVAHAVRRDKDATVIVLDGKQGPVFPSIIAGPVFSPDNRQVAFAISENQTKALVIDEANVGRGPGGDTDFITHLTFAPGNGPLAYIGVAGGTLYDEGRTARARRRVYVDGVAGPEYNVPYLGGLEFSVDGKHVAYVVGGLSEASRSVAFVVVNGHEGKRYDDVFGRPRLDGDRRTVTYTAQSGRKFYAVSASIEDTASR
jgi:hypothetical protein